MFVIWWQASLREEVLTIFFADDVNANAIPYILQVFQNIEMAVWMRMKTNTLTQVSYLTDTTYETQ